MVMNDFMTNGQISFIGKSYNATTGLSNGHATASITYFGNTFALVSLTEANSTSIATMTMNP